MDYKDYRRHCSVSAVPAQLIKGKDGVPVIARVNRIKAIDFLKQLYDFKTREEVIQELQEVTGDINGT